MKRALRALRERACRLPFVRPSSGALPSFLKAMDALVPKKVIREVMASSHDRRQWGTLAAAWVGVSEREFFRAAAKEMNIDLQERVEVPDLSLFGPNARTLFAEMRAVGAVVVIESDRVVGLVCVDPSEARGVSFFDSSHRLSIGTWTDIARALEACERALIEREVNGEFLDKKRRDDLSASIINILVREAVAHGAETFDIVTTDGKTRYQFYTSHGKLALGSIHSGVVSDLLSVLRIGEGAALTLNGGICAVVRSLGSGANFKISWTTEKTPQMSREVSGVSGSKTSDVARHEVGADVGHNCGLGLVENTVTASDDDMGRCSDGAPILVVDDNPMFCRVLRKLLVRDGLAPYFAANGIEALDKLAAGVSVLPRVIICDLHMPIMNGREFLSHIKGDKRFNEIPVLVLTSDDDADAELQLLQFGADAFVSKTKDPRVLTSHIQRLLRQARIREAA